MCKPFSFILLKLVEQLSFWKVKLLFDLFLSEGFSKTSFSILISESFLLTLSI